MQFLYLSMSATSDIVLMRRNAPGKKLIIFNQYLLVCGIFRIHECDRTIASERKVFLNCYQFL
jgi:hypothetical protein